MAAHEAENDANGYNDSVVAGRCGADDYLLYDASGGGAVRRSDGGAAGVDDGVLYGAGAHGERDDEALTVDDRCLFRGGGAGGVIRVDGRPGRGLDDLLAPRRAGRWLTELYDTRRLEARGEHTSKASTHP